MPDPFYALIALLILGLPVISIVFFILWLLNRRKAKRFERDAIRMNQFIKWLYAKKRISDSEYNSVIWTPGSERVDQTREGAAQPPLPVIAPSETAGPVYTPYPRVNTPNLNQQVPAPQPVFIPVSSSKIESIGTENAESTASVLPIPEPIRLPIPEKKSFNAMNILLIIGVMLITLAGAIFVTTTWNMLPPFLRILVVCSFSVIFFIGSVVADKALGIPKTALSFFAIASVFLPISVLAVGFFKLAGSYFSWNGDGRYWVLFAASIVLGAACFFGARKYQYTVFAEVTLYCVTAAYICMVAAFYPQRTLFITLLYLYAALLIIFGNLIRKNHDRELPLPYISRRIPGFATINSLSIAVVGVIISETGLLAGLPAILIAPLFLFGLFRGKDSYFGTIVFAAILTSGMMRLYSGNEWDGYIWMAVTSVVLVSIIGTFSSFPEKMRKWFTFVSGILLFSAYFMDIIVLCMRSEMTATRVAAMMVLLVALLFVAYRNKERWLLYVAPVIAVSTIMGFVMLFEDFDLPLGSMIALLVGLFFAASAIAGKKLRLSPRTSFSDILFSLLCLFGGFVSVDAGWGRESGRYLPALADGLIPFLTLLSILIFIMLEKLSADIRPKSSSIAGGFIPAVFFLCSVPVYIFANEFANACWVFTVFYALTAALGIWAWIKTERLHLPRTFSLGAYGTVITFAVILRVFFSAIGDDNMTPAVAWIAVIYLCVCAFLETTGKTYSEKSLNFTLYSFVAGASVYVALILSARHWAGIDSMFYTVLIPAIAACAFCAAESGFLLIDKRMPPVLRYIGRIGVYGLSLFTAILVVLVAYQEQIAWITVIYIFAIMSLAYRYLSGTAVRLAWFDMLIIYAASFIWIADVDESQREWFSILIMVIIFVAATVFGRLIQSRGFKLQTESEAVRGKSIDWPTLTSVISAIGLLPLGDYARWIAMILLGVYALTYLKQTDSQSGDRYAGTISALFFLLSIWIQPLVEIPDVIILEFNLIAMIGFFVLIDRLVWKNETSRTLVFTSSWISLLIAGVAAIFSGDIIDSLIIGIASFLMLVISFLFKLKRWFITASVAMILIVFYMTREFWAKIYWWIYLLLAGLILIGLAAANEKSKKNGEKLSNKVNRMFRDWQ